MSNKYIDAMRMLSLQAIWKAKQGHAGMSMSAAPLTYTLYTKQINIAKEDPKWFNRDRFVLSAGHGSLSIYTVLHFAGLLTMEDMESFKTKHSKTPGHPEYEPDNFIDASTGPLGQGVGMAVGMAIAEKYLAAKFSTLKGLMDHHTYAVLGDGDLQEGIAYEAMSLAGTLKLNKLIFLHDSNNFQLDSSVSEVFTEDLEKRMESMEWDYIRTTNEPKEINAAIKKAKTHKRPTFIEVKTIIGEGLPTENSNKAHSMALTEAQLDQAADYYKWSKEKWTFDSEIYTHFREEVVDRGDKKYNDWKALCAKYKASQPKEYAKFVKFMKNNFTDLTKTITSTKFAAQNVPTRNYVKDLFATFDKKGVDWLISGCADLVAATNIKLGKTDFGKDPTSNNILFGIREFSMSAIANGIVLHGGLKTVTGTFLVFSDYMKSAIRLGAMMERPNFYIFTHDSYQVGGDGPTHQPVDQLAMLRAIPNVVVHKPCDEVEFAQAAAEAMASTKETHVLVLTRHPLSSGHATSCDKATKGGYVLTGNGDADITLVGAGSEIDLLFASKELLEAKGISVKVVSVPSLNTFLKQPKAYITKTLASKSGVFSVEPSSDALWYKLAQYTSDFYHLEADSFGLSMDGGKLYADKGFNPKNVVKLAQKHLIK